MKPLLSNKEFCAFFRACCNIYFRSYLYTLKSKNIKCTIAPTPRVASKSCGISLLVNKEDIEKIRECVSNESIDIIDIVEIEKNIRPNRDRYC